MSCGYFDLETTGLSDDAQITVAVVKVVAADGSVDYRIFHSGYGNVMTADTATEIVDALESCDKVFTFNGAAFDYRLLAATVGAADRGRVVESARCHRDVMLDFAAHHGYYASMASFENESASKTNTGAWAATAWFQGAGAEVAEYCKSDVDVLHALVSEGSATGRLIRTTTRGRKQTWVLHGATASSPGIRTARESLAAYVAYPPPVTWMTDPPNIANAMAWAAAL